MMRKVLLAAVLAAAPSLLGAEALFSSAEAASMARPAASVAKTEPEQMPVHYRPRGHRHAPPVHHYRSHDRRHSWNHGRAWSHRYGEAARWAPSRHR